MIPGQLQVFLSPTNFEWYRMMSQSPPGCQDSFKMAASKVASFKMNFFRIEGTSEADTSAECLLAIGEDKKSKPSRVTFSFNNVYSGPSVAHQVRAYLSMKGLCNISNTRDSVSLGIPNTERRVENKMPSRVFLTKFEVFG